MKMWIARNVILLVLSFVMLSSLGYAGSNMEGTYATTAGNVVLDLKSGDKAIFTLMGESMACRYNVKDEKLVLDCTPRGEQVDFVIHGDGSIRSSEELRTKERSHA